MSAHGVRHAITRAKILAAMDVVGEASVPRLCHVTHLSDTTIYRHIREMHQAGQVHIVRCVLSTSRHKPPVAMYRRGPGVDASHPTPAALDLARMEPRPQGWESVGTLPAPRPLGLWGLSW